MFIVVLNLRQQKYKKNQLQAGNILLMMQKLSPEKTLLFVVVAAMQAKVKNNSQFGYNQNIAKNVE